MDNNLIRSALRSNAPNGGSWQSVCTVCTDAGRWYLVTGYDCLNPLLSACKDYVEIEHGSIYRVFSRNHPAIAALNVRREPHTHYSQAPDKLEPIEGKLFKTELTPEGEQFVIPGCEKQPEHGNGQGSLW